MAARGDPRGYYRELGVHRTATAEEIRLAFRERAKLVHPDHAGSEAGDGRFKQLAEAYEVLKDPRRRLHYDAEGLAAERQAEREREAQGAAAEAAPSRGRARARAAADAIDALGITPQPPPWLLPAAAGAGALLVLLLGLLGWGWSRAGSAAEELRREALLRREAESRLGELDARYRAETVRKADPAGAPGTLFSSEIPFAADATSLDDGQKARLGQAVLGLARALRTLPADADWLIVIDGHAGQAADAGGVRVADWQAGLLRLGLVVDWLVAQGLPADRLATRFEAGFTAPGADAAGRGTVELRLLCCLGG